MNNHKSKGDTPINLRALELIRAAFDESPLTQDQLAERSGIARSTLANMLRETGESRLVHVEQLVRIAAALGVDPAVWINQLEDLARSLSSAPTVDLAEKRAQKRSVPKVQKKAARKDDT